MNIVLIMYIGYVLYRATQTVNPVTALLFIRTNLSYRIETPQLAPPPFEYVQIIASVKNNHFRLNACSL